MTPRRTPADEVHLQVADTRPDLPAPAGHYLRIYHDEEDDGRIHLARGAERWGPWEELGRLDVATLHVFLYDLGLVEIWTPDPNGRELTRRPDTFDLDAYRERRRDPAS